MWCPSSLAKLVYNSNNLGLWMFMADIAILHEGYKPTNLTLGGTSLFSLPRQVSFRRWTHSGAPVDQVGWCDHDHDDMGTWYPDFLNCIFYIHIYIYLISILIIHHHTRFYWDPQGEINQTRCFLCQVCGNSSWACCWFHLSSIDDQAVCFVRLLCVVTPRLQLTWPLRFCSLWFAQALVAVTAPIYIHLSFNLFFY